MLEESKVEMPPEQRETLALARLRVDRARVELDLAIGDLANVKLGPEHVLAGVCQIEGVVHAATIVLDRAEELIEEAEIECEPLDPSELEHVIPFGDA